MPSAWAWKLVLTRCRSTGMATFLTSSMATLKTAVHRGQRLAAVDQELPGARAGAPIDQLVHELGARRRLWAAWRAPAARRT